MAVPWGEGHGAGTLLGQQGPGVSGTARRALCFLPFWGSETGAGVIWLRPGYGSREQGEERVPGAVIERGVILSHIAASCPGSLSPAGLLKSP